MAVVGQLYFFTYVTNLCVDDNSNIHYNKFFAVPCNAALFTKLGEPGKKIAKMHTLAVTSPECHQFTLMTHH
jgi:hypothetical protein